MLASAPLMPNRPNRALTEKLGEAERSRDTARWIRLAREPRASIEAKLLDTVARHAGVGLLVKARTFWGGTMTVALPEPVSAAIHRYGLFEADAARAILSVLRPGHTFFDVGAHFGFFSLLASHVVGTSGRVVAFEPTPRTFALLTSNLAPSRHARAENLAVFSHDGTLTLRDLDLTLSAYNSAFTPRLEGETRGAAFVPIEVSCVALDSFCEARAVEPDVVKIDAESAELEVLLGMDRLLRTKRPALVMELGDLGVSEAVPSRRIIEHLAGLGYQAFECDGPEPRAHEVRGDYAHINLLFRHGFT